MTQPPNRYVPPRPHSGPAPLVEPVGAAFPAWGAQPGAPWGAQSGALSGGPFEAPFDATARVGGPASYSAEPRLPGAARPGLADGFGHHPPRRRVRLPLVLTWVVLVIATAALGGFVFVHVNSTRTKPVTRNGTVTRQGQLSPSALQVGDCAELPPLSLGTSTTIASVDVLPCSQSHNAQVFSIVQSSETGFPGDDALTQQGLQDCQDQLPAFLGTAETALHIVDFVPSEAEWDNGDRSERCLLVDRAQDITGDIRPHA